MHPLAVPCKARISDKQQTHKVKQPMSRAYVLCTPELLHNATLKYDLLCKLLCGSVVSHILHHDIDTQIYKGIHAKHVLVNNSGV